MLIIFLPGTEGSDQWGWEGPGPDQQITIFAPGLTGSDQPGAQPDIVIVENIRQQAGSGGKGRDFSFLQQHQ